ncbi:MAG: glycosyltransferase family 2 protein [Longimicrobiales bacterium]|nr:glycosyltransferase family 2 protein [Longimicrobiales bacterium]
MIYICIPTRDEASTVGPLLWKVRRVFGALERDFHLLVFDDASSDDTREVLARYEGTLPLTVLRSEERVGYGGAVDTLLRKALQLSDYPKRDAALVLQADFTDDLDAIEDLVKRLEGGADIVAGTVRRWAPDSTPRGVAWARRLAPWVLGPAFQGAPADPLCSLRAYRLIVLTKALRDDDRPFCAAEEPWVASLELLHRLVPDARRVEESEVRMRYDRLARASRFSAPRVLTALFGFRDRRWTDGGRAA